MNATALKSALQRMALRLGYQVERARTTISIDFPKFKPIPVFKPRLTVNEAIVASAKKHLLQQQTSDILPPLGERWGAYASRLRARIGAVTSAEELLLIGQSPESGIETNLPPHELVGHYHLGNLRMLETIMSDHIINALQSFHSPPLTSPAYKMSYQGREIDFVSMCAGIEILTILYWLDGDYPIRICDIGGGTGKYAHAWLTNSIHRPDLIVILDIPETLVFSETLLRSVFGDAVQYISDLNTVPNASGIVLCPLANAEALKTLSFDLVTNTGSMQEMTDAWIDWYMDWLDRQSCRYFYSDNFFANALMDMREGHNSWSPRPSARWQMIYSHIWLGVRNIALMLFQKDSGQPTARQQPLRGAQGWLQHLDIARRTGDEASYRQALEFAAAMPFMPKEAWQVAKALAAITKSEADHDIFRKLDRMRMWGVEAAH
jgi:hypothetical protein